MHSKRSSGPKDLLSSSFSQISWKTSSYLLITLIMGCGSGISRLAGGAPRLLPASVNFGDVALGETVSNNVAVFNDSATALTIGKISLDSAVFSLPGNQALPISIAPHATHTLVVGFQPQTPVDYAGQLTLLDTSFRPMAQTGVSGSGRSNRKLSFGATSLGFESIAVKSSASETLVLTSTGTSAVTINAIRLMGTSFALTPISLPVTLVPNETLSLNVVFTPVSAANLTGSVTIQSNASPSTATASLSGIGVPAPRALTAALGVSATALNFGTESLGVAATQVLILTSTGTAPLTVNSESLTGSGFAASGIVFPLTLQPSQSRSLSVAFKPLTAGAVTGQLAFSSNALQGASTLISLQGMGAQVQNSALSLSATSLSFGSFLVGSTSTQPLTLTSTGSSPLIVNSSTVSGADFALVGGSFPITLAPSQSTVLQVRFAPPAAGPATGVLSIASNATKGSTTTVGLSGVGTAVAHEADLYWTAPTTSADPVAGYNVYRIDSVGSIALLNVAPNVATSYADHSVQSGSQYQYIVKSVDSNGNESIASNEITALIP